MPRAAGRELAAKGISLDITDLDRAPTHLQRSHRGLVADALALPFRDGSFDLVSCSLFAHHLQPCELARFAVEASRVSRYALLINDLIRHPLHLALVYAGFPLMRSYVSRIDGVASVRRSYTSKEMRNILADGTSEPQDRDLATLPVPHGRDRLGLEPQLLAHSAATTDHYNRARKTLITRGSMDRLQIR